MVVQLEALSTKERAALFVLLAEARELTNAEIEERVGFRLSGQARMRLNDLKLVESRKAGRMYVHELTDAGWYRCTDELSANWGSAAKPMERALYTLLHALGRYLDRSDRSLADLFAPSRPAEDSGPETRSIEASIFAGYQELAGEPGDFIKLSQLRRELASIGRDELDATLDRLYQEQYVNLIPQSNQRALTAADRESALRIGGEDKHLISIEKP
ncbi:hypothetical protein [Flindersiella endophytica]